MNLQEDKEIKSRHDFYTCFSSDDEDDEELNSIIPDLSKTTLISVLDEDDEKDNLDIVSGYNELLDELVDIYRLFEKSDMKQIRDCFSSKFMKPTIEKLHKDFEHDFKDVPTNDPIRIKCLELLGYFGIPVARAEHPDLS